MFKKLLTTHKIWLILKLEQTYNKIMSVVCSGSEIWTDCWRGYIPLETLGGVSFYVQKSVNHIQNFIDPKTGTCTNAVENFRWK